MSIIILYHGTVYDFDEIDVNRGRFFKDFGRGFYTAEDYNHAVSISRRNQNLELERNNLIKNQSDLPIFVYSYSFDTANLKSLNVKQFLSPDAEWVDFVVHNRSDKNYKHGYDLVIGATADDNTRITIQQYLIGAFGDVGSNEAIVGFLKRIKSENLSVQWLFATKRAVSFLKLTDRREIR